MPRLSPEELISRLRSAPSGAGADFPEARAAMEVAGTKAKLHPDTTVTAVDVDGVPGEWVVADGADEAVAVLYLHGGGYTMGSCATHRALASHVSAAAAARVLTIDYRLAPEHPYPAGLHDAVRAWHWLTSQPGADPSRTVIAGDSAGGGLAAATVLALMDQGESLPALVVCLSPWVDLTDREPSAESLSYDDPVIDLARLQRMRDAYVGDGKPTDPLISPVYGDWSGAPPMLIQVGEERLIDDARALAAAAQAEGVDVTFEVWPGMVHVWHYYCGMLDAAEEAVAEVGEFVRRCTVGARS